MERASHLVEGVPQGALAGQPRPHASFVILTWNSEPYIARCLKSILALTCCEPLVMVVDNGSCDGTVAAIRALGDSRIRLYRQEANLGTTRSRNIALRDLSDTTDYVCILDSDTEVNDGAIARLLDILKADAAVGIAGPRMRDAAGNVQLSGRNLPSLGIKLRKACPISSIQEKGACKEVPQSEIIEGVQRVEYLLSACWVMRREVLRRVGLLDERIFYAPEDVDYCVRVQRAGYDCVVCHDVEIVHDYQRLSKRKLVSKMNYEHLKGLAYYFKKYGYLFDAAKALEG